MRQTIENKTQLILKELESRISNRLDAEAEKIISISRRNANWASDLAHPCLRYLVYSRLNWQNRKPPSKELIYRFREGQDQERIVKRALEDAGFDIILSQQYFSWERFEIVGKVDGFIILDGKKFPIEIKGVSPYSWEKFSSIEAIKKNRSYWIRRTVAQLDIYLLMTECEIGFLIPKTFGKKPKILAMEIDYELGEELVKKAEVVNECVKKKQYPERIEYSSELCGNCPFEHICMPLALSNEQIIENAEDLKKLYRWAELKQAAKEFQKLDKELKERFRGQNVIIGDFSITSKEVETTIYRVPDAIKKQFAEKKKYWRVEINEL